MCDQGTNVDITSLLATCCSVHDLCLSTWPWSAFLWSCAEQCCKTHASLDYSTTLQWLMYLSCSESCASCELEQETPLNVTIKIPDYAPVVYIYFLPMHGCCVVVCMEFNYFYLLL